MIVRRVLHAAPAAGSPHGSTVPVRAPGANRRAFRLALRRPRVGQEIDAEIAFHLQMRAAELEARGYEPDAARAEAGYPDGEVLAIYDRLLERVRTLPGVASASVTTTLPFQTNWTIDLRVPGLDSVPLLPGGEPLLNLATPEFMRTLGVHVVRGRGPAGSDRPGTERVVVVNETAARRLWPGREALVQCVKLGASDTLPCGTVVGVAEDVRWDDLRAEPRLQLYGVLGQHVEEIPLRTLVVGGVAAALLLVAVLASVVPAWRASRVDPNVAQRSE